MNGSERGARGAQEWRARTLWHVVGASGCGGRGSGSVSGSDGPCSDGRRSSKA